MDRDVPFREYLTFNFMSIASFDLYAFESPDIAYNDVYSKSNSWINSSNSYLIIHRHDSKLKSGSNSST